MRQPNAKNCWSVSQARQPEETAPEKKKPIGAPSCGNMPSTRAWLAGHSRSPGARRHPIRRRGRFPARTGRGQASREPRFRSCYIQATHRSRRLRCPWWRGPRRAFACGRYDHRSGQRLRSRWGARGRRCRKLRAMPALTRPDRKKEKDMRKHQDRSRGDVKVKELNCCPYQAGEEDLAGSVDFLLGGPVIFHRPFELYRLRERKAATIRIADQTDNDRSRA